MNSPPAVPVHPQRALAASPRAHGAGRHGVAVFFNVVLRYGFGSGVRPAKSCRACCSYGWFSSALPQPLPRRVSTWPSPAWRACWAQRPLALLLTAVIRLLVMAACAMLGWGARQQVVVGMDSHSVVLAYPAALLPLPAFLLCRGHWGDGDHGRIDARQNRWTWATARRWR